MLVIALCCGVSALYFPEFTCQSNTVGARRLVPRLGSWTGAVFAVVEAKCLSSVRALVEQNIQTGFEVSVRYVQVWRFHAYHVDLSTISVRSRPRYMNTRWRR